MATQESFFKKNAVALIITGVVVLPMVGCGGLLTLGAVAVALSGENQPVAMNTGQLQMPNQMQMQGQMQQGQMQMPQQQGPMMPYGGYSAYTPAMPSGGGGGGSWVQPYDAMKSTPGVNGFGQYIRDESTIQSTQTGEITPNVSNEIANPIVQSGEATVVNPDSTSSSSGSE